VVEQIRRQAEAIRRRAMWAMTKTEALIFVAAVVVAVALLLMLA
jgi:hypothetical protein